MSKKAISFVIALIGVVVAVFILTRFTYTPESQVESEPEVPVVPINILIDNTMSSFEQTESFDRAIRSFMRKWEIAGASFALMRNDSLLYAKGYGYANKADSIECDVNHVFRVASISKLLTATAIMKLVEQEHISLDSQVFGEEGILCDSMFLDVKYKNLEQITVEHLLRHTAGFSSPVGDPAFSNASVARVLDKQLPLSVDDMVLYAIQNRLRTRPGGSYNYSNLGYVVLGKIVEVVSTIDYESYLKDSILAPVGCYDMYIGKNFSHERNPNEVEYYEVKEAEPVEAYDGSGMLTMKSNGGNNVTLLGGAGGWVASPVELLKFVASIDGNGVQEDILEEETIRTMTYDSKEDKPIGWAIVRSDDWLRSGSMAGTCALIKKQSNGYTWVFVTNSSTWIGPRISNYMSSQITQALSRVSDWPERDLFDIASSISVGEVPGDNLSFNN